MRERLNAKLRQVKATLRRMRHMPIPEQGRYLRLVLNGFYNYYAVECAPGAGQIQAAVLTICRAWLSSNWAGLR